MDNNSDPVNKGDQDRGVISNSSDEKKLMRNENENIGVGIKIIDNQVPEKEVRSGKGNKNLEFNDLKIKVLNGETEIDEKYLNDRDVKQEGTHWVKDLMIMLIPTCFPLALIILSFVKLTKTLELFVMSFFFILLSLFVGLGYQLLRTLNEDSISGMVAQRFNKLSYVTILMITGTVFYTSSFIVAGGITTYRLNEDIDEWVIILAALSPIISFLILIFPIVVEKSPDELGFYPIRTKSIIDKRFSESSGVDRSKLRYEMKFYKFSVKWHSILHFICIGCGLLLGYISIIHYINVSKYSTSNTIVVCLTIVSGLCCMIFFVGGIYEASGSKIGGKKFRFFIEFLGLYYYIVDLILVSVIAGDMISHID